jgi:outer membrane protein assembly factor BamB
MHQGKLGLWLAACAAVAVGTAGAADWSRFRGPNGTGVAADKGIPVKWTARDVAWKRELPGAGNSSPVIWGDRLFVQSASGDGRERYLICLGAADGKVIWSRTVPGAKAAMNPKNTWASSTPATDGERVYALFWDGRATALHAFSLQGEPLWQYDLGAYPSQHGPGASPIVRDGKVYLLNDHDKGAALVAVDARTGKRLWEAKRDHYRACYSTPFFLERPGRGTELIVATTTGIMGYDPDGGAVNWEWHWSFDGMPLRTVASPVYGDGLIFANGGDGSGLRHTVAIKPGDKGDVTRTNLVWEQKRRLAMPYVPCFLVRGDYLFGVNDDGTAGCYVAKTGEPVWVERLGGGEVTASPVLIDGKVYVVSERGNVYVFPAEPAFKLLAKNALGEPALASPAVADGRLFLRGETHLFCIKAAK